MTIGPLLNIRDLSVTFRQGGHETKAVDHVSFSLERGKTLALVGESGSGKSISALSIVRLLPPGAIASGEALFDGENMLTVDDNRLRAIRGAGITMVFQEPMTSLNPVFTIGYQIEEAIRLHQHKTRSEAQDIAMTMLRKVGIGDAERRLREYPHQLSGGMKQRAMIAMALVCQPTLLIADEPTTALDVTTQATILDLMQGLQQEHGMALLFITHDLGVVAEIADEVVVMYLGQVAESGPVDAIFHDPKHPYTRALLESIPRLATKRIPRLASIRGMVPHPFRRPAGCPFHPRCDRAIAGACNVLEPPVERAGENHTVRCLLYSDVAALTSAARGAQ